MYRDRADASLALVRRHVASGSRVLEVGSGAGELSERLKKNGYDAFSNDIALRMAAKTRNRMENKQFVVADVSALPFRKSTFDAVVLFGVISYLADEVADFEEHQCGVN